MYKPTEHSAGCNALADREAAEKDTEGIMGVEVEDMEGDTRLWWGREIMWGWPAHRMCVTGLSAVELVSLISSSASTDSLDTWTHTFKTIPEGDTKSNAGFHFLLLMLDCFLFHYSFDLKRGEENGFQYKCDKEEEEEEDECARRRWSMHIYFSGLTGWLDVNSYAYTYTMGMNPW